MQETHLSHKQHHTLQQIFQHPASHNLEWHNVVSLMRQIGTAQEAENGHLTFTHNGISEVFRPSAAKDVAEIQQVLDLRHFLERAGVNKDGMLPTPEHSASPEGGLTEKEQHLHDQGHVNAERSHRAEQELKTQQHEQNDRSGFMPGNAQSHQQGNRQK